MTSPLKEQIVLKQTSTSSYTVSWHVNWTVGKMTDSVAEAMQATTFNAAVTTVIEYKRRLPDDGQRWIFTRAATKMLQDGRMDLDVTMFNENIELLCTAHQLILVLEAQRKFHKAKSAL
ncbi:thioesterase-like superfamily protein [Hirsutella rhossiliensis]|uniref:Thioesterase-like superfamily domain-containing protein n=1 Tax=Hirsutella rhossiliensis TaxID=111463 RepID=A0A9P8N271_9HYPO|nr:thioesterase-like superfamily domain-containing protein [Hirsutella rhossiliensis]KAH0965257.1 thioesterase-like superfamily domain-containing protein [Hirsutella rhossiliensis]